MAYEVEVVARKYYSRINGIAQELPIGTRLVIRNKPDEDREGKLKLVGEVEDSKLIVNDNPEAARLRDEGKTQEADKKMADAKEKAANKRGRAKAKMPEPTAAE